MSLIPSSPFSTRHVATLLTCEESFWSRRHARRAVANGHVLRDDDGYNHQNTRRMALASALGNARDLEGELEQVRLVLKSEPGNIHERLTLGQSLIDRGELESAVPELLMALQLPPDTKQP